MNLAVLVPVKAFDEAKQRLRSTLGPDDRRRLAQWMAERVVAAAGETPVFVVCDDTEVQAWAADSGATPLWTARLGLNGAVDDGVSSITAAGFDHVIVAHADLPVPDRLVAIARTDTTTLVPDRRRDGTNVMAFPLAAPLPAAYGPGSFRRHLAAATGLGQAVEVRMDPLLALDVDTPADLLHPLIRPLIDEVLPT